jgi:hypothetical protein
VGPSQDVAGLGPTSQVALPTKAGAGLIKTPGSGLTGKTGSSLISQDGGGLLGTDKVAPLISQDGGGAVSHTTDTLLPTHPTTGLLGGGNPGPDANTGFVAKPGTGIGATADAPNPTPSVVPSAKPRLGVL